jgi:hypothetical protein
MAATTGITDRLAKPDTSRQQWKRMFGRQRRKWRAELRDRGAVSLEPIYVRAGQRRRGIVAVSDGDGLELRLLHMADGGSRCRTVAALNAAAKLRQMRAPVSAIREALSSVRAMRCTMDLPILSRRDAEAFLRKIHAAGLMFHLEDDPATILGRGESPLFSPSEIVMLRARIAELYALDWGDHGCPIGYLLQLQREGLLTEDHHETR